jgi:hypothetical protein
MGGRACWGVGVLLLLCAGMARGNETPKPSFTCRAGDEGRLFTCTALNVDGLHPRWELKGRYVEWGPTFRYYAPPKWTAIEMLVQTDENTYWLVRGGEVKLWRGKAVFRCIANAACSQKAAP